MIFVTIGNWPKGYDRLIKAVDKLKNDDVITDDVIAQIGHGSYHPSALKSIDTCGSEEFDHLIKSADIIISHAGIGTISTALKYKKIIIVVPRKASLGEIFDDHQFATAKVLEQEGKILVAYETEEIPDKLEAAKYFVPAISESENNLMMDTIANFIRAYE